VRTYAFTVIIPAHNEAPVIARCLKAILADAPEPIGMEIIVAANGCNDDTADIARKTAPDARVIELPEGSKSKAMNAAKSMASHPTCLFLDADVVCSFGSLAALARALDQPGVMAASPALRMDLSRSSAFVRAYYQVWLRLPYVTDRMVGSGCFGLSSAAMDTLGEFPDIIGDDIWVRAQFDRSERQSVSQNEHGQPVFFVVSPPRTWLDQIRVESRRRVGNSLVDADLAKQPARPNERGTHTLSDLLNTLRDGASWFDLMVYAVSKLAVIGRVKWTKLRGSQNRWERDLAAREA